LYRTEYHPADSLQINSHWQARFLHHRAKSAHHSRKLGTAAPEAGGMNGRENEKALGANQGHFSKHNSGELQSERNTVTNHPTINLIVTICHLNGSSLCQFQIEANVDSDGTLHLSPVDIPDLVQLASEAQA